MCAKCYGIQVLIMELNDKLWNLVINYGVFPN
jgi:hypothetical protein